MDFGVGGKLSTQQSTKNDFDNKRAETEVEAEGGLQWQWQQSESGQLWQQQMTRSTRRHENSWRAEKLYSEISC